MSSQPANNLNTGDEEATIIPSRITFQDNVVTGKEARVARTASTSRRRSASRDSIRSMESRVQAISPESGVQIQFRTLSIQVSEAKDIPESNLKEKPDEEYFSNLKFHKLDADEVCQQL